MLLGSIMQFLAAISLEIVDSKMKIIVDVLAIIMIGLVKSCTPREIITLSLMIATIIYFIVYLVKRLNKMYV